MQNSALMLRRLLEEVFVTEGVPEFTFVPPPNFNDILLDVRRPGKPVIIEGQSGTGKTTCIKKVLEKLGTANVEYLTARQAADISRIEHIVHQQLPGTFVTEWGESENNRRAKFYRLTKLGLRQLKQETANWGRISAAMAVALEIS
jgi:ABC-type phosphonate transport system ATPase subunit